MVLALKVVAIVQARMSSTRLPGKVLRELCDRPMIEVILDRTQMCKAIDSVVVATTVDSSDDVLVNWLKHKQIPIFRGSVSDVLDRFYKCAEVYEADIVIRVTADDPLKDAEIIQEALDLILESDDLDYVSNTINPTYPEGLDIEVIKFTALQRAALEASLASDREHVTPYIWRNPDKFNLRSFHMTPDLSSWRWTVDKPQDLTFMNCVFNSFGSNHLISYRDVIQLIRENPSMQTINSGTMRNEGYLMSRLLDKRKN